MITQITNAGAALQAAATAPLVMTGFVLGSGSNYVPTSSQTALQGSTIYTGLPGAPVQENQNTLKYPVYLGDNLGPFQFGEIGLYYGSTLFAICVFDTLISKFPLDVNLNTGGSLITDVYVPIVSTNYEMYSNTSQANTYKASVLTSVAELPYSDSALTNFFVIQSLPKPFLAYTDRVGEWHFDGYRSQGVGTVVACDLNTITISLATGFYVSADMIVQAISGSDFGLCRRVESVTMTGAGNYVLGLDVPLARALTINEEVRILSSTNELIQGGSF